jgi:hypothetical protein
MNADERVAMAIGPLAFYSRSTNNLNVQGCRHAVHTCPRVALPTWSAQVEGSGCTI